MRFFLSVVLFILLAYVAGFALFVARLPPASASLPRADAIVALTGGGARLDAAIALFESGTGKRLLISGVDLATTKASLKHLANGGRRFDCCADIGYAAEDTHGNAEEAASWAASHKYKSLILVTASYHMPRALAEFHAVMPNIVLVPYPVLPERVDLQDWWRHPHTLRLLHHEYAKYLASLVMTRLAPGVHAAT